MRTKLFKIIKWLSVIVLIAAVTFFAIRVYDTQRGPALAIWHTYVPDELRAKELAARRLGPLSRPGSQDFRCDPDRSNRKARSGGSSPIEPVFCGQSRLSGTLLTGLQSLVRIGAQGHSSRCCRAAAWIDNSPYSQRHIAETYRDHGFVAIVIRLPGTVQFRPA